ncbi:NAD(P)H-binding protein [Streptomyces sp. JJ66]|uniref:SDR family oxidoreductase n=1 Tax=Streptomyces sp. JJ66 TaxID=2803843 RepID=UPI001C5934CB|nr:NAD(P)H-binding protein [Streptomyces sp. JJ66]MBW1600571.1 NAD(P)H-binding protein [Streptomyces sp. JJ66]
MDTAPVLVTGATGSVGRRVAAQLRGLGAPVRAASRRGPTPFDWTDEATWEPALDGVRGAFLLAPDGVGLNPRFVAQAVDSKVRHLVLLSSRAIEVIHDERLLAAERAVRDSGAEWTVVRSDWFDQNFDEGAFRAAVLGGELAVPVGSCKQTFVDLDDVAAVCAAVLTAPEEHAGRTYEVTGPRALSFAEACATITRASGRPVTFHGEEDAYLAQQAEIGRSPQDAAEDLAAFAALRALGDAEPQDTVVRVAGRPARPFEEYAAAAAAAGSWTG